MSTTNGLFLFNVDQVRDAPAVAGKRWPQERLLHSWRQPSVVSFSQERRHGGSPGWAGGLGGSGSGGGGRGGSGGRLQEIPLRMGAVEQVGLVSVMYPVAL